MKDVTEKDTYSSIKLAATGLYKESGSKFISLAFPVSNTEEIHAIIKDIKKEHFNARHHCYAYRLGIDGAEWRAVDDGEPSSTAGKPILGQIISADLSDVLIVVVRYFGGVKLGVGGLIKAYKSAAADVLCNAQKVEKRVERIITLEFDFEQTNSVMKLIKEFSLTSIEQDLSDVCKIVTKIRLRDIDRFINELDKLNIKSYA